MDKFFDSTELYNKIDKMREEKHWSIYELAKRANITENAIYNWRDRKSTPSVYLLANICAAFDIPFVSLFIDPEKDMVVLTEVQKELLDSWVLLNHEEREAVMRIIKLYATRET